MRAPISPLFLLFCSGGPFSSLLACHFYLVVFSPPFSCHELLVLVHYVCILVSIQGMVRWSSLHGYLFTLPYNLG